jgi:hypothetical protein
MDTTQYIENHMDGNEIDNVIDSLLEDIYPSGIPPKSILVVDQKDGDLVLKDGRTCDNALLRPVYEGTDSVENFKDEYFNTIINSLKSIKTFKKVCVIYPKENDAKKMLTSIINNIIGSKNFSILKLDPSVLSSEKSSFYENSLYLLKYLVCMVEDNNYQFDNLNNCTFVESETKPLKGFPLLNTNRQFVFHFNYALSMPNIVYFESNPWKLNIEITFFNGVIEFEADICKNDTDGGVGLTTVEIGEYPVNY